MTGLAIMYFDTTNSTYSKCFLIVKEEFYSRTTQMFCYDPASGANEWVLIVEDL